MHTIFLCLGRTILKILKNGFYQKYKSLIDRYDIKDDQTVILCSPPRAFSKKWGINDSVIEKYISKDISSLADEFGYKILDINSILNSKEYFQKDCIHFNSEGTKQVASLLKKVLSAN